MPTPSPIIVASVGETAANVTAAAIIPSTPSPVRTATTALTIGRAAPSTVPKPSNSTTIATTTPITSDVRSPRAGLAACPSAPP